MKALKGNIIFTASSEKFEVYENSYLVESDGTVIGIFKELPSHLKGTSVDDFGDSLIIPGFVDMHLHAPQFQNMGLGLDEELLQWLEKYTFPEEAKYSNEEYAKRLYTNLAKELWRNGTTRVALFSTIHRNGTEILMDVFIAHRPNANYNLSSGIMPARKFLDAGIKVGLGTDIGAGHQIGIYKVMNRAVQSSKINWLNSGKVERCLTMPEAFYMGTKGGGEFFGKVGSFESGYSLDALVIDDENLGDRDFRSIEERLQRFIYCGDDRNITKRYVAGKLLSEPV